MGIHNIPTTRRESLNQSAATISYGDSKQRRDNPKKIREFYHKYQEFPDGQIPPDRGLRKMSFCVLDYIKLQNKLMWKPCGPLLAKNISPE
jgi:hypothetical protein